MRKRRGEWLRSVHWHGSSLPLALAVSVAFLCLYGVTLLPDVLPADAGEFQFVAQTAGVAHPPGYPLYTLLGWVFTRLPIGPTPAWRVNLLSAVTAAAALGLVFCTARRLTGSIPGGVAATLTLGSATTFWATATGASVRPLTAFFTALCLYALTEHAARIESRAAGDSEGAPNPSGDGYLIVLSLALSLGLTHHPSLAFPGVVFVLYLVLVDPALLRQPRRWLKPLVAFLLGLLVLIYLPLRGGADLSTVSGFLDHVLARGFRGDMFALNLLDRLVLLPTLLRFQFNLVLLSGMLVGALFLLWRDWRLALLLIGSFLVHTAVTLTYDAPQTVEYQMPAYVSLALLVAVPFGQLSALRSEAGVSSSPMRRLRGGVSAVFHLFVAVLLIAGGVNLVAHLPSYRSLSRSRDAREYAETVLKGVPPNGIILSNWHWFTPLRYVQQVEGTRPDVEIEYVAPRGEPLARTWVRLIEAHIEGRPVVVARYFEQEYGALSRDLSVRFEPLGEAYLVRREPRVEVPADMTRLDVTLGGQIELLGYRLDSEVVDPGRALRVTLAWSPTAALNEDVALFAQLIGGEGRLWSAAEDPRYSAEEVRSDEVILQRFAVYPLLHAPAGDYAFKVGAYSSVGRLTAQDGSDAVRLDRVRVRPSTTRPVTEHPRLIRFDGGPTLIGVDYNVGVDGTLRTYLHWAGPGQATHVQLTGREDAALTTGQVPALKAGQYATLAVERPGIPEHLTVLDEEGARRWNLLFRGPIELPAPRREERYVPLGDAMVLTAFDMARAELDPGSRLVLRLRLVGQRPLERDYIVSAALTGLNPDGSWAWRDAGDGVPALGAIPTLKWIRGSAVLDLHRLTVPAEASEGPVLGSFSVYDHFTQRLLPPLDKRPGLVVELGTWDVTSQ